MIKLPPLIKEQIPLADKNWFKTGGSARYYAEPTTPVEFQEAVAWACQQQLPIFILGQGANVLISDAGFDGLLIRPQLLTIEHQAADDGSIIVHAGAGVTMHDLILYCLDNSIGGLEEFSGIPGTVGGSVYINLHYYEFLLEQFLLDATIMHKATGALERVTPAWFSFGYDHSTLMEHKHYLVNATFKLKKLTELETAFARGRRQEIIRHRVKRFPATHTCGSFFRNFHDHEVTLMSNGKKMIYVAYYLDALGLKGHLRVGDAVVSYQHANMLVNSGNATSTDLITLARLMQEKVQAAFGIIPQPECQLIGFKEYPLL